MQVSQNEAAQMMQKAAIGCGFSADRASDLSGAALWLVWQEYDGPQALAALLSGADAHEPLKCRLSSSDRLESAPTRTGREGVAALDWLAAQPEGAVWYSTDIDSPLLLTGLIGYSATEYQMSFEVTSITTQTPATSITPDGISGPVITARDVMISRVQQSIKTVSAHPVGPIQIPDDIWQQLGGYAAQTYVPSSEQSRLSGAGAGIVEND